MRPMTIVVVFDAPGTSVVVVSAALVSGLGAAAGGSAAFGGSALSVVGTDVDAAAGAVAVAASPAGLAFSSAAATRTLERARRDSRAPVVKARRKLMRRK